MMSHLHKKIWQVSFHEIDGAGMVHFTHFYKWMELIEHDFLQSQEIPVAFKQHMLLTGWPKTRAECIFLSPLRFGDTVEVQLEVDEVDKKRIRYCIHFMKQDGEKLVLIAEGSMTTVYAQINLENATLSTQEITKETLQKVTHSRVE